MTDAVTSSDGGKKGNPLKNTNSKETYKPRKKALSIERENILAELVVT